MSEDKAVLQALLRTHFSAFYQKTFKTLINGEDFIDDWYIQAICYHLQLVMEGKIKRLIITIPPRMGKSLMCSVAFPAYLLGRDPSARIICCSYGQDLAQHFANQMRAVMAEPWYKDLFPKTRQAKVGSTQSHFKTTLHGSRFSSSVGGPLTGLGGNIIIVDDPQKADEALSDTKRQAAIDWCDQVLSTRLDNKVNGSLILIQQRIHEADLAGHMITKEGSYHLNLKAIAEESEDIPIGPDQVHHREPGDLLDPVRLPQQALDNQREMMGAYPFAAQYQQSPAPADGGIVKTKWLQSFKKIPQYTPGRDLLVQSWDTATTVNAHSDYSVCTSWLWKDQRHYLLHVFRKKLEYPDLRSAVLTNAGRYAPTRPDFVLIENTTSSMPLIQDLRMHANLNIMPITPQGDKRDRMMTETPAIEAGRVFYDVTASWGPAFLKELSLFPNGNHDDQVDSVSQYLYFARMRGYGPPKLEGIVTGISGPSYLPDNLFTSAY